MGPEAGSSSPRRSDVFLTYLDDGGKGAVKIFGGIVMDHEMFHLLEGASALIGIDLVRPEHQEKFEFHASDLFAGTNAFEGIDAAKRHQALGQLLALPKHLHASYVYSAID